MGLAHGDGWAIPFDAPFYPELPAWYRNVAFQMVEFRADPDAVARLLPAPLEPSPGGECVATGILIPFSSAYGPINEGVVQQKVTFRGEPGWYCSHVWHNGPRGIAAGREIYGTPKVFSDVDVHLAEGTMVTRASMAGVPIVTISSTMETRIGAGDLPSLTPGWQLKLIPRADGPGTRDQAADRHDGRHARHRDPRRVSWPGHRPFRALAAQRHDRPAAARLRRRLLLRGELRRGVRADCVRLPRRRVAGSAVRPRSRQEAR